MSRILLIDDDDSLRAMLRDSLVHYGFTVTEARDGREGLDLLDRGGIDLVITDIVMPVKEGLEVLMELRRRQPPVKIIAISGGGRSSAMDLLQTAALMGASKVIHKPFSHDELIIAICELLSDESLAHPPAA
jgi:DNA-binding response OmpR family regulator